MQNFNDTMDYVEEQISELNPNQINILSRKIVDNFLQKLPPDWEKTELEIEQPIYLKIADLLKQPIWDFEAIEEQLQALDEIADNMEDYPADTDFLPMTLFTMSAILPQLNDDEKEAEELQDILLDLVEQYLNIADYFASEVSAVNDANWLNHPVINQAFEQLQSWINDLKN